MTAIWRPDHDAGDHDELRGVTEAIDEAHQLWHEAQHAYHDPPTFQRRLNALIQGARNITWRLQSAKDELLGFDDWYKPWQEYMRGDARLRWLRDARTHIVKKSGLASRSRARVTVIYSYLDPARLTYDLPPELPSAELVATVAAQVPEPFAANSVVEIERRWEVDELPGAELLDAVAECLRVIVTAADQAHGLLHGAELLPPNEAVRLTGSPDCMVWTTEDRLLRLNPSTGAVYEPHAEPEPEIEDKVARRRIRRYGWKQEHFEILQSEDPLVVAEGLVPLASRMLKADGHHTPMVWLHRPDGGWDRLAFAPEDRADKYFFWHLVAQRVAREGHDGFVSIGEFWTVQMKPGAEHPYPDVAGDPDRKEALLVTGESADGRTKTWEVPFRRRLGRVVLSPMVEVPARPTFPDPVRRVWAGHPPEPPGEEGQFPAAGRSGPSSG